MTEVIEIARQKLRKAEAEVERLRAFLDTYAALTGDKAVDNESPAEGSGGEVARTASPAEIVESAHAAMRASGRPLSRSQILKVLKDQGLNLPGKDATKNIGTVIWRSKRFVNVKGVGYWPKDAARWMGQRPGDTEPPLI